MTSDRDTVDTAVGTYLRFTRQLLPALARSSRQDWPVDQDHCFQRIVLDTVCGGVWYRHIKKPAYRHLTPDLAEQAVRLCEAIAAGRADLDALNKQSLVWRGKWRGDDRRGL